MIPSGRGIATRADLLRSTGFRHAWRRYRQDRALGPLLAGRGERMTRALWLEAAHGLGATATELGPNRLEIRLGDAVARVTGQTTALNTQAAVAVAADKPAAYERLARAGLPVPEHLVFDAGDARAARRFLERGPLPCVVKPARGSGGDGVTGEIRTPRELGRAVLSASRFCSRLLVERQVEGDVFRLLVLDGRVLDVVRRLRPRVVGDGRSTIAELVLAEYDRRLRAEDELAPKPFAVDHDCLFSLEHGGLSLRSVPAAGEVVVVKSVTNANRREDNLALGTDVAEELRRDAVAAAAALDLRLAGVDAVAPTPSDAGTVIDVNPVPGLHHHAQTRVAAPILRALLDV